MHQNAQLYFPLFCAACLLASCTPSTPSESTAKREAQQWFSENGGIMRITEFHKINGVKKSFKGVEGYEMEVQALIRISLTPKELNSFRNNKCPWVRCQLVGNNAVQAQYSGKIQFVSTDNGWKLNKTGPFPVPVLLSPDYRTDL